MQNDTGLYDFFLKTLLIGDSGVGKSSILLRFTSCEYNEDQLSTVGVDFKVKYMTVSGKKVKLFIWDTAGQERFRTLTSSYYRGAQGVVLVYDCSSRASFSHLNFWLNEVEKYCSNSDAVKMLVANKIDSNDIQVTREEGERFAVENSMLFVETSAKTNSGIQQAFEELVLKCLETPNLLNLVATGGRKTRKHFTDNSSVQSCLC